MQVTKCARIGVTGIIFATEKDVFVACFFLFNFIYNAYQIVDGFAQILIRRFYQIHAEK